MKAWVFKINTRRGWEFRQYFTSRRRRPFPIGDRGWIRSARSLRLIRDEVKRGDLFLCYEVDRRLMVGLTRAACDGQDTGQGPLLFFCPPPQALWLGQPLHRHPDLDQVLAFTPQRGRGTVGEIARDELARIRRIALKKNPGQAADLARLFMSDSQPIEPCRSSQESRCYGLSPGSPPPWVARIPGPVFQS